MEKTLIVYDDVFLEHLTGPEHPESPDRLRAIMKGLREFKLLENPKIKLEKPRKAGLDELCLVHSEEYVDFIESFCRKGGGVLGTWGGGVVCSRRSFEVACYAVGGALKAVDEVLNGRFRNSIALIRPPGHHASTELPYGFCIFNNVAVAAKYLMEVKGVSRIAILDVDAHHGNGTQEVFEDTSKVLYVSFHQDRIFPGTGSIEEVGRGEGEGFKINFPLPPYSNEEIYLKALNEIVAPILDQFKPAYIFVSAGFDAHHLDPLTGLGLSSLGYVEIYRWIMEKAEKYTGGRFTAVLEGGYDCEALGKAVPSVVATMAGLTIEVDDPPQKMPENLRNAALRVLEKVWKTIANYWTL
ncbi:MAG: histone deacetylase [Candidatus Bathyarchaeia archaeon]